MILPDHLRDIIARHVAAGHAGSEADFVATAVARYADELDATAEDDPHVIAALKEGIADMQDGRVHVFSDFQELHAEMQAMLESMERPVSP